MTNSVIGEMSIISSREPPTTCCFWKKSDRDLLKKEIDAKARFLQGIRECGQQRDQAGDFADDFRYRVWVIKRIQPARGVGNKLYGNQRLDSSAERIPRSFVFPLKTPKLLRYTPSSLKPR